MLYLLPYVVAAFLISYTRYTTDSTSLDRSQAPLSSYGHYEGPIGYGSSASVAKYVHRDGRLLAVKQYKSMAPNISPLDYLAEIFREWDMITTLDHENIIRGLDLISDRGQFYLVTEYGGDTLFDRFVSGRMDYERDHNEELVSCLFGQLLNGVFYLHEQGVAHLDLKPGNVVVSVDRRLRIIDFGTAIKFGEPGTRKDARFHHGRQGTVPFLPPETYNLEYYDPRGADIWACAMIFCQISLPQLPWKQPGENDDRFGLFSAGALDELRGRQNATAKAADNTAQDGSDLSWKLTIRNLVNLLPSQSRNIIEKMLDVDVGRRAGFEVVFADEWIQHVLEISCMY